jgi:hypothetical protein
LFIFSKLITGMFVAFVLEHYFCLLEFKFEFEFSCLDPFPKKYQNSLSSPFFLSFCFCPTSKVRRKPLDFPAQLTRRPSAPQPNREGPSAGSPVDLPNLPRFPPCRSSTSPALYRFWPSSGPPDQPNAASRAFGR